MKTIKVTELRILPDENGSKKVYEQNKMEGDFNLVNPCLFAYQRYQERNKLSYIFRVEIDGEICYRYSLTSQEKTEAIKLIPSFK